MKIPEINAHTYCHLSSENLSRIYSGERSLFNKWYGECKKATCKTVRLDHYPIASWGCSSVALWCSTLCDPMDCSTPGFLNFTISQSLLKLMSIESVMPSNHLVLCRLLLLSSIYPWIRVFSNESALHSKWPKYCNFNFSNSPSNSGLISIRTDLFDLLAIRGILKSLLKDHSSKVSILWRSGFFMVQLSHPHDCWKKNMPLIRRIFVNKIMSLLCNMLSGWS